MTKSLSFRFEPPQRFVKLSFNHRKFTPRLLEVLDYAIKL